MNSFNMRAFMSAVLIALILLTGGGLLFAQEPSNFDAKKKAFCQKMLRHGEEAYRKGQYEKAGYYLQQAVQADAARMAQIWFKLKGVGSVETSAATTVTPTKATPATTPPKQQKKAVDDEVVIMDDEGC